MCLVEYRLVRGFPIGRMPALYKGSLDYGKQCSTRNCFLRLQAGYRIPNLISNQTGPAYSSKYDTTIWKYGRMFRTWPGILQSSRLG
jgi:hypothetical protein